MCLEFSKVSMPILKQFYDTYSFGVLPKLGKLFANDEASYQYLAESIRKFPDQKKLLMMIKKAGFQHASFQNLLGGITAIHI